MQSIFVSIAGVIVIAVLIAIFNRNQNTSTLLGNELSPSISPLQISVSPTASAITDEFIQADPAEVERLRIGGSSYLDSQGVYSFLYPNDYALDHQEGDKYIRISKRGATQRGQTEMYDGIIVVFERADLAGQGLAAWIDAEIQQVTANGTSQVLQPRKATTLNSYPGFTYQLSGLGDSTYLVLQKDAQSIQAVRVTFLVADPQNKNYQKEVAAILVSLKLLE